MTSSWICSEWYDCGVEFGRWTIATFLPVIWAVAGALCSSISGGLLVEECAVPREASSKRRESSGWDIEYNKLRRCYEDFVNPNKRRVEELTERKVPGPGTAAANTNDTRANANIKYDVAIAKLLPCVILRDWWRYMLLSLDY